MYSYVHHPSFPALSSAVRNQPVDYPSRHNRSSRWYDSIRVLGILLCIPFIQLGQNVYLSFQVIAFGLLALLVINRRAAPQIPMIGITFVMMLMSSVPFLSSPDFMHSFLKISRECLCFSLLYVAIRNASELRARLRYSEWMTESIILLMVVMLFVGVAIQYYYIRHGRLWFVPSTYFVMNGNLIPTPLDLRWSRVRPSATFGEPSYVGFVATSMLMIVLYCLKASIRKIVALACIIGAVTLSQTLAGIMAVMGILGVYYVTGHASRAEKLSGIILLTLTVALLIYTGKYQVLDRIFHITSEKSDASSYARIVVPIRVAADILGNYPIGIPTDEISRVFYAEPLDYTQTVAGATANGLLNLMINYGVVGFWLIYLMLRATGFNAVLLSYVVLSMLFNGSIYSYDKVAIVGLVFIISAGNIGHKRIKSQQERIALTPP